MVVLRFNTRILVVQTYCVDGISYLGAHVMLSIVNDHLSNKWMKKNIQALYLITIHLKKGIVLVSKVKDIVNWFKKNLIVISIPCYLINLKLTYIKM